MRYYYDAENIPTAKEKSTSKVKEEYKKTVSEIAEGIKNEHPNCHYYWTRRTSLGYVFTEFKHEKGKLIGAGAKGLRESIQDTYDFVLLSNSLRGKYQPITIKERKGIRINIEYFNNIFKKAGNTKKVVELFLSKPSLDEFEKDAIKRIVIDEPEKLKQFLDLETTLDLLRMHGIEKPEEFTKVMQEMLSFAKKHEMENYKDFEEILEKTVRFFDMYKIENPEEFTKVANALIDIFEKYDIDSISVDKFISSITKQIKKKEIKTDEDFEKIIEVSNATEKSILKGYAYFEKTLAEFKEKIDSDIEEIKIRDFVFKHIWLLDFKYFGYRQQKEESSDVGRTDLTLYKDHLGLNTIVINEFKRPDEATVTEKDRPDKPAILAKVGRAISQTIHYMEEIKAKNIHLEGYVIIGRNKEIKDSFLKKFNEYLHGIKIRTFDDLHDEAKATISMFKQYAESKNQVNGTEK